jgi:putative transcriptional regulator
MNARKALFALAAALLLGWSAMLPAAELSGAVILVAKPELRDNVYGATILIATPLGRDQHVGFIINRPTSYTLGKLFPDHGPSQKVAEPVYLGGPFDSQVIFALVQRRESPGGTSIELMPGLYAALDGATVDGIIESQPEQARFVAGLVAWRPGELQEEIKRGLWYVLEPDAALVLRKPTEGLWEELVRRSQRAANTI